MQNRKLPLIEVHTPSHLMKRMKTYSSKQLVTFTKVVEEKPPFEEKKKQIIKRVRLKMKIYYIFKKARDTVNDNVIKFNCVDIV